MLKKISIKSCCHLRALLPTRYILSQVEKTAKITAASQACGLPPSEKDVCTGCRFSAAGQDAGVTAQTGRKGVRLVGPGFHLVLLEVRHPGEPHASQFSWAP